MDEKSIANRLDTIFSDVRINPVYLAMLTRRIFGRDTNRMAQDWWTYHNIDFQEILHPGRNNDMSQYD